MKSTCYILFCVLLFAGIQVDAQIDGSLDPAFDPGVGPNAAVGNMVTLPDGKVLICLGFNKYNNVSRSEIARINTDGSLDNSFDPGTGAAFGNIRSMVIQPDGRIIIGGTYTNYDNKYTETPVTNSREREFRFFLPHDQFRNQWRGECGGPSG